VEKVARGSRAAANGLQAGDVIVAANSGRFDDLPGFRLTFSDQRAATHGGVQQLVLGVVRGNEQGNLLIQ